MEETKWRIRKIGTILRIFCQIGQWVSWIALVVILVMLVAVFWDGDLISQMRGEYDTALFDMLTQFGVLDGMELVYKAAIGLFLAFLGIGVTYLFLHFFEKLLTLIVNGEQPFTREIARRLRKLSYTIPVLVFYRPVIAVVMFFVALLLSYLFEYGAYLQDRADETKRIQEEMILSFAEITENKSEQTGQHIRRVSEYSRILAQEMGLSEAETENIRLASTMHDIGKLLIPTEILEKPARLTDEEFAEIKKHSGYGGQLLNRVEGEVMTLARTIALEHHERCDGKGYPDGKSGEDISLEGRIVAVADVYDALTSRRSYKEPWEHQRAYEEIVKGSGTQFDAGVVEAFQRSYERIDAARKRYADE